MIRNHAVLVIYRRQLALAEGALDSLHHDIYHRNARNYAVFSESYIDMILQLRSEIDAFLQIALASEANGAHSEAVAPITSHPMLAQYREEMQREEDTLVALHQELHAANPGEYAARGRPHIDRILALRGQSDAFLGIDPSAFEPPPEQEASLAAPGVPAPLPPSPPLPV